MNPATETIQLIYERPWEKEPNRLEFEHCGLPVLIQRNSMGALCGYVAVPQSHPWHGKQWSDPDIWIQVHGGLTYSAGCDEEICHAPKQGEADKMWWFGFDCAHAYDLQPKIAELLLQEPRPNRQFVERLRYCDIEYVKGECRKLAEQLFEVGHVRGHS